MDKTQVARIGIAELSPSDLREVAATFVSLANDLDAERLVVLEAALRTIREAIPGYLKGEMSEHDFALVVLGVADSKAVNLAMKNAP